MTWRDNSRHLTGWRKVLWAACGNAQPVRRLIGGRWESWWTDVVNSRIWYPVNQPGTYRNRPAPVCRPEWGVDVEKWPARMVSESDTGETL